MKSKLDLYKEDIISLYKDGKSTLEIGEMFSVSHFTIYNLLKKEGIELRKCYDHNKIELPIEDIISLYNKGNSTLQISKMFNVNHNTINNLLKREGIELRKPGGNKIELPIEDIVSLYKDGKSTLEISKMFSVNHNTINRLLKREGIELRKRSGRKKRELPIDDIISLYKDGKSTVEIAGIFSVGYNTISNLLKREGIELRKPGRNKIELPIGDIISLYKDGKNTYEIADILGVSPSTINTLLKREGVELRKRGDHNKRDLPIKDIVSLYKDGKSTLEIGDVFSINHTTINTLLKREGVELRNRGGNR